MSDRVPYIIRHWPLADEQLRLLERALAQVLDPTAPPLTEAECLRLEAVAAVVRNEIMEREAVAELREE